MGPETTRTLIDDARTADPDLLEATPVEDVPDIVADEADTEDPREDIEIGVLMANGRLAPRHFATWGEAEEWALPEEGERVVEYNILCECSFNS